MPPATDLKLHLLLLLYVAASLIALILYAFDKRAASRGDWRIPEKTLHLVALVGGWPGALLGQQLFRHKRRKTAFLLLFWLTVAANLGLFYAVLAAPGWVR